MQSNSLLDRSGHRRRILLDVAYSWLVGGCLSGALVSNAGCSDTGNSKGTSSTSIGGTSSLGGDSGADASSDADSGPLRVAAKSAGKLFGCAVNADAMRTDSAYAALLGHAVNYVTPENAMKWGPLAPSPTTYSFGDADDIVAFAEAHGQAVKGHALIWHNQLPSWVSDSMSADDLRAAMQNHINTMLTRYHGRVRAWDVVNEAIDPSTASGYTDSVFYRKLGSGFIEEAFRMARAADPEVLLYYNEFGIERIGKKADLVYALMQDLLQKGVPIDGIGFQSHVSMQRYPSEYHLRTNIERFAALGLKINISELDVRTLQVPGDQATRWQEQRIPFQQVVGICIDEPACEGVTIWGITDKYAWQSDPSVTDEPLIFDQQFNPKPAYDGVLAGLSKQLPVYGENLVADTMSNDGTDAGRGIWTSNAGAVTSVAATPRDGVALCVTGRTDTSQGLIQDLLQSLSAGGQYTFSAWVKIAGASSATINFAVTTQDEASTAADVSLGSITAIDADWVKLSGNFGLGSDSSALAINLKIYGAPAGIDICVSGAEVRAMTPPGP